MVTETLQQPVKPRRSAGLGGFFTMNMKTDELAITGSQVRMPQWVVILLFSLLAQAFGGAWWAATQSSDLRHEIQDRQRLEQQVEFYKIQIQTLREKLAEHGWNPDIDMRKRSGD